MSNFSRQLMLKFNHPDSKTCRNIRTEARHWKVRLIEEEFQRLMFAEAVL